MLHSTPIYPLPQMSRYKLTQISRNGLISGFTGAAGNLGGVAFAVLFRFHHDQYQESFWILGCLVIGLNLCLSWVPPIPKNQIGGR